MDYQNNFEDEGIFISGRFFYYNIPKEQKYLLKYFKNDLQKQFLRYVLCYRSVERFTDHTGYYCNPRWLAYLKLKLEKLETAYDTAKKNFDLETVAKIEKGKYRGIHAYGQRILA